MRCHPKSLNHFTQNHCTSLGWDSLDKTRLTRTLVLHDYILCHQTENDQGYVKILIFKDLSFGLITSSVLRYFIYTLSDRLTSFVSVTPQQQVHESFESILGGFFEPKTLDLLWNVHCGGLLRMEGTHNTLK